MGIPNRDGLTYETCNGFTVRDRRGVLHSLSCPGVQLVKTVLFGSALFHLNNGFRTHSKTNRVMKVTVSIANENDQDAFNCFYMGKVFKVVVIVELKDAVGHLIPEY